MADLWHRLPVKLRAGTHIDWRTTVRSIDGPAYNGGRNTTVHGYLDLRQRVYQSGGELKNFLYQKERLLSLALSVWLQVQDEAEWLELIDHELNRCYRIRTKLAAKAGRQYQAGIGPRWGVPIGLWDVSEGPVEPERPEPSPDAASPTVRQLGLL